MNPIMTSASRCFLVIAAIIAALSGVIRAANYSQGDEITLTRDEPLLFRDQVFRQGKAGEKLTVLAHRLDTKKVFVSATDKAGKQIAISLPEDAVSPVPVDPSKLSASAVTAAGVGKYPDALRLIDQAIRSAPSDFALPQTRNAITRLQEASGKLARAQAAQRQAAPEAARIRKNATVVDRPNPLKPGDTSNQDRAQRMRTQADEMEQAATQNVADAENQFRAASDALLGQQSRSPAPLATGGIPGLDNKFIGQQGLGLTPAQTAHNKAVEEKEAAERAAEAERVKQALNQWLQDKETTPPIAVRAGWHPTYDETMELINGKLRGFGQRIWFGTKTGKMIVDTESAIFAFDPASLNPEVKFNRNQDRQGGFEIVLECTNSRDEILVISKFEDKPRKVSHVILWSGDQLDQQKVVKACGYIIQQFGGKKDSF